MSPGDAVAVLWSSITFSAYAIAAAAADVCRLVWVVDLSDEGTRDFQRLLVRLGDVVDLHGKQTEEITTELRALGVTGITTYLDSYLPLAANLATALAVPYHSPETARLLTDKHAQRAALAAAGVPSADCVLVHAGEDAIPNVTFPVVIKPRYGSGSRNSSLAWTPTDLAAALAENASQDMLVEAYLEDRLQQHVHAADVVSVESLVQGGAISHLAVTGRFPLAPPFRGTGNYLPCDTSEQEETELYELAARAIRALGVEVGITDIDIKRTPSGPHIVEVNGRLGGNGITEMFRCVTGCDLLRQSLLLALGCPPDPHPPTTGVGWYLTAQAPVQSTAVVSIEGLDSVAALEGVEQVRLNRPPGATVDARGGSTAYVYAVEGALPDHASVFALRRRILDTVTIRYS